MKSLITIVSTLFGSAIAFFAQYVSYKIAILFATIVAFTALNLALVILFKALLVSLYLVMPIELQHAAEFLPTNISVCITALISGKIAIWLYQRKMHLLKFHASLN